eukprot:1265360-Prymnesium_polylepis.1
MARGAEVHVADAAAETDAVPERARADVEQPVPRPVAEQLVRAQPARLLQQTSRAPRPSDPHPATVAPSPPGH